MSVTRFSPVSNIYIYISKKTRIRSTEISLLHSQDIKCIAFCVIFRPRYLLLRL